MKTPPNSAKEHINRMVDDIEREVEFTRSRTGMDALNPRIMEAMKQVPRHQFVPSTDRSVAYWNGPLPIGHGQTISQPYIVALMTDLVDPRPEDVVLEVGTGSGYQAAILSRLVKKVYTMEAIPELATQAAKQLKLLGYDNIESRSGDGYYGWPEHAPYDGILVTAAAPHVPEPLVEQLKPGARLVIPVGGEFAIQQLLVIEKGLGGNLVEKDVLEVAFVPLTGRGHRQPADTIKSAPAAARRHH